MILKKLLSAALPFGLALGLNACGSDDASSSPTVPTPPDPVPASSAAAVDPTPSTPIVNPTPIVKNYGILPSTADINSALNWYNLWKSTYVRSYELEASLYPEAAVDWIEVFGPYLQAGLMPSRVVWDAAAYDALCVIPGATDHFKARGCTVSEGIGYGMIISVFAGDYATFNSLWTYNRGIRAYQNTELMPWKNSSYSYEINAAAKSSATDADMDIATALILAYYSTGLAEYLTDALKIVKAMWDEEVSPTYLLYSGNTPTWKKETSAYNLSYFSPIALKLFAAVDPDPTHQWTKVLDTMYAFMRSIQTAGTGVLPDWVNNAGVAINPNNNSADKTYWMFHQESVRIPWRLAWDYYWTQDTRAAEILNTLNAFISEKSAGDPANLVNTGKVMYSAVPGMEDGSTNKLVSHWYGAWCLTGMAGNQAWLDKCVTGFNTTQTISGFNYFPHILQTMYSELMNGMFVKPAAMPL